jgi:hypothetical protein
MWEDTFGRVLLAVVLISAALGKTRSFSRFVLHLRVAFRQFARPAAIAILAVEGALAVALVLWRTSEAPLLGSALFFICASLFIAIQLMLTDRVTCDCWGARGFDDDVADLLRRYPSKYSIVIQALRPVWYGVRNGFLLLGAWLLFRCELGNSDWFNLAQVVGAFVVCPLLIGAGLVGSIHMKHRLLSLDQHPLRHVLEPRLAPLIALAWYRDGQPTRRGETQAGDEAPFTAPGGE